MPGPDDEPVLLLPPDYQVLEPEKSLPKIAQLLELAVQRGSRIQALTFAIKGPEQARPTCRACCAQDGSPLRPLLRPGLRHAVQPSSAARPARWEPAGGAERACAGAGVAARPHPPGSRTRATT